MNCLLRKLQNVERNISLPDLMPTFMIMKSSEIHALKNEERNFLCVKQHMNATMITTSRNSWSYLMLLSEQA